MTAERPTMGEIQERIGRHIPDEGDTVCPGCGQQWPCPGYREATAQRDMATEWSGARIEHDVLPPWGSPLPPTVGNG